MTYSVRILPKHVLEFIAADEVWHVTIRSQDGEIFTENYTVRWAISTLSNTISHIQPRRNADGGTWVYSAITAVQLAQQSLIEARDNCLDEYLLRLEAATLNKGAREWQSVYHHLFP